MSKSLYDLTIIHLPKLVIGWYVLLISCTAAFLFGWGEYFVALPLGAGTTYFLNEIFWWRRLDVMATQSRKESKDEQRP